MPVEYDSGSETPRVGADVEEVGCGLGCGEVAACVAGALVDFAAGTEELETGTVEAVSDGAMLDDAAATDEDGAEAADEDVEDIDEDDIGSITGMLELGPSDGLGVPRASEFLGAEPIATTSTAHPPTAAAAAAVEMARPIRMGPV